MAQPASDATAGLGASLDEVDEQFRLAFVHAPIGIALVAPDGTFLWVNRALCRILGYRHDELTACTFQDITHPDDLDADLELLGQVIAGQIPAYSMEKRYLHADGHEVPAQLDVSLVRNPDGTPRSFVSHVQDITDRRATLAALADAHVELRTSEQRFAALVERSADLICLIDADGRLQYASPAGERLTGFATGERTGEPFADLVHPDDLAGLSGAFAELVAAPGATRMAELRLATASGAWRPVEVVATNRLADPAIAAIVANVRDVSERADAATRLSWMAFHDSLTDLPNRALLDDRLAHAVDRARLAGDGTALLFLDLDRFKLVNDSLGHGAGDQLLVEVAHRLVDVVGAADTVARLGGDEFVVLVEGVTDRDEVSRLAARIGEVVAEPIQLAQGAVTVTASIGIAFDTGVGTADHLLRDADTALYRAKEKGRDRAQVFNGSLRTKALRRVAVEQGLREALAGDGLEVHHQPIVDLASGVVVGTEALLRIRRPDGSLEPPSEYIAVADESGLIVPLGARVLDRACGALATWRRERGDLAPSHVGVNVSGRELGAADFSDGLERCLDRHGLAPTELVLEFTEATVIGADRLTLRTVERLHDLGVRLVIDDFGTGYSSLAYLKRFPIQAVKLDRTFVGGLGTDPSDAEIVRAVVMLGRSLGLSVVAEGIETVEQLAALQELGCGFGQGYLLARPSPADDLPVGPLAVVVETRAAAEVG